MRYKKIMMLVILFVSLLAVSAVSAADNATSDVVSVENNVTGDVVSVEETTDAISVDEADEVVSVEDNQVILEEKDFGNFTELSSLIENTPEGGTLNLSKNYKYVNGSNEGIQINKPITIDGKGHTLDGNYASRIFYICGNNVVFKNINFINANIKDNGAAINWNGDNGKLVDCNFSNCSNRINVKKDFYYGGAIYWNGINANISFCNFVNNDAWCAAGLYISDNSQNCSVLYCNFINNAAEYVAGVQFQSSENGLIYCCNLINNKADFYGSLQVRDSDYTLIEKCNFENNTCEYNDGTFDCSSEEISIINCTFKNNNAYSGGGIKINTDSINIINCSFINNTSQYVGGAIDIYGNNIEIFNCIFNYNKASTRGGGAIFAFNSNNIHIGDSYFKNNYIESVINSIHFEIVTNGNINNSLFVPDYNNIVGVDSSNIYKTTSYAIINDTSLVYGESIDLLAFIKNKHDVPISNNSIIFVLNNGSLSKSFILISDEYGCALLQNELNKLSSGTWNVTVIFEGTDNYAPCNVTATITVLPPSTSLTIDDVNATVGHEVTLVANVNSTLTVNEGIVTFFDGENSIGESNVVDGVATLTYAPSIDGEHEITAIFSSGNYLSSNDTAKLLVDSASIEVLVDNGTVGYNSTFVANVKGLYSIINDGTVTFYINDEYIDSVPVVDGSASLVYTPLIVGNHTIKAIYENNANFLNDQDCVLYVVDPLNSTLSLDEVYTTLGHETTIIAHITSENIVNEGTVTFYHGNDSIGESQVVNGTAIFSFVPMDYVPEWTSNLIYVSNFAYGNDTIYAIFNGYNYRSSKGTANILLDKAKMKVSVITNPVGFNTTFLVNITKLFGIVDTGNVNFYLSTAYGNYIGYAPIKNGTTSFNYVPLNAGNYDLHVLWSSGIFDAGELLNFTIEKANSKLNINDLNGTSNHEVILTAHVSSSNNLTINEGYVVFFDGETNIGEVNVVDSVATLTCTPSTAGEHTITAIFNSDNYKSSNDTALLTVAKADVDLGIDYIADVYYTNPSKFAINVNSNSKPVNEGKVKYYVNNELVGTVDVYEGNANFNYVTNAAGSFTLTAAYEETDNYFAKNASTTFNVNKMPTSLSGESIIFDEEAYKTFTTELKDNNNNGVGDQPVKIEVIKYSGESATFNGISDANGITIYDVGRLAGGMWYVTGIYAGNNNYINSRFVDKFIVVRMNTTTEIEEIDNPKVNHNYKLKANIHDENGKLVKEGIVQFYLDGVDIGSIDLSKNQGHQDALSEGVLGAVNPMFEFVVGDDDVSDLYINYVPTKAGKHTLTAVYEGTTIYKASNSTTTFVVTEKINTTEDNSTADNTSENTTVEPAIVISPLDNPSSDGSVKVSLPGDATGKVTLTINGKSYNYLVENGVANVVIPNLGDGDYPYTITYSGDSKYSSFTNKGNLKVNKAGEKPADNSTGKNTTIVDNSKILASNVKVTYAAGSCYSIKVYGKDGKLANGAIVKISGKISKTLKTTRGIAKFKITQVPGTYKIKITALGKSLTKTITVKKATPKLTAAKKTFKRTVKVKNYVVILKTNKNKALKAAWVSLKVNKKTYKVKTNVKGQAIFKINNLARKGTFNAVVKFAGNKYYNAKTVNTKIFVR